MGLLERLRSDAAMAARRRAETRDTEGGGDAGLALMLAQQAIMRWRFELDQGRESDSPDPEQARRAAADAAAQVRALAGRVERFRNYVDMAVRFEAEEVLVSLGELEAEFARLARRTRPDTPWRDAAAVAAELGARRH